MLIYDIEIERAIASRWEQRKPGVEYCDGWHDYAGMGIAAICAYHAEEDRYRVFLRDNLRDFEDLVAQARPVIGFNSLWFDDRVCQAAGIRIQTDYDLRAELLRAAGLTTTARVRGYRLDDWARANLDGVSKSGHGAEAPIRWQRGERGWVIDYCLQDVKVTAGLVVYAAQGLPLIDPVTGHEVLARDPHDPQFRS